jgi:hypothetical protein
MCKNCLTNKSTHVTYFIIFLTYEYMSNSLITTFFISAGLSWFPIAYLTIHPLQNRIHNISSNASSPNCTNQIIKRFKQQDRPEISTFSDKKNTMNNRPKMQLISINFFLTFACLSFTATSISSSFFSMSRRSKAYRWN